ncbi:MAG TPA: AAA family ATPase [Gaiellaceae bacterium]|nr:AAA family ATPase [Gaiellaceae bacterium]
MILCADCGRENPDEARFCLACGARLQAEAPGREERKVVSVLFADVVGFTSQAEKLDPEDVRATLSPYYARLRAELERRGGTVEKFIGDAVMAVFGAPVVHEDDPERAVRAGIAIRDSIVEDGQLQVRVAVTTGEALVSLDASLAEGEGLVAGDVVNTAARLQSSAPVNGILVDETTQRATAQAIEYREAKPVVAKGKAEPVRAWEAVEARSRFGVDVVHEGVAFVGRRRELDFLTDAFGRAREQRAPQLVTLVGVPGIGKSRLVYELSRVVDAEEELVFWRQGRSLPYGEGVTYWALAEMAKAQAGILESDSPEEAERKLSETITGVHSEHSERLLAGLRPLVGLGSGEDGGGERSERFAAWREFLESLAEQRPTVLVFEDLHWADDDLLDFVDHLVDWSTGVPLLVVCTARPELLGRRPGWGGGKPNALTISIAPLSDDETAHLLASLLERSVLPAEVQSSLLARAGGNPLYAEQFARLLVEVGTHEELPLPENVQGIIAARLDGLPAVEKQLLQDAAVLGKVFWLGAACAVSGIDRDEGEARLHALERKEFVRRERRSSVAGEGEYAFRHLLVRDVAYGQIPRGARAQRHERAAAWLEALGRPEDHAEMLVHHYLEAIALRQAAGNEASAELAGRARLAARDAGDRALALGAFPAAGRFFESALELWPADDEERPELLLAYARARVDDVTLDDAVLAEATEGFLRAGKLEQAAEAEGLLGGVWLNRGDRDQSLEHLERARELVEDRGPSPAKAYVYQELARVLMMAEELERSIELVSESLELAETLGMEASRSRNLNTRGVARILNGDTGGLRDLERAVEIGAAAHSHEEASAAANLTWMHARLGNLRRAGELHEQSLAIAERLGVTSFIRWQQVEHVFHCYWGGRWDEALATADEYLAAISGAPSHYMEGACRTSRAAIWLARGRIEEAIAEAKLGTELARPAKDAQSINPALAFEAFALLAQGGRVAAGALADELVEAWRDVGIVHPNECADAPWVFIDLGRTDELEQALGKAKGFTPWHEAARRVIRGDPVAAAEVYAQIGSVPDEAHARLRAAEAFVPDGRRAEADAQLGLALPVFAQLGAAAWTARGEALLAESA